ncbi:cytosol aminopeptidase-like [Periplaneta americana]|uniref:cytosol aminopeptidase-like n=1 Tax=Periplaneta americana TaxID=6978 RepID=UPI0037E902F0
MALYRRTQVYCKHIYSQKYKCARTFSYSKKILNEKKGLVVGVYVTDNEDDLKFTPAFKKINEKCGGKLLECTKLAISGVKVGKGQLFYNLDPQFPVVSVVGLGKEGTGYNEQENIHEGRENARIAASVGCRQLRDIGITNIVLEGLGHPEAAAEGATLGVWQYEEFKNEKKQMKIPQLELLENEDKCSWERGVIKAEGQNLSRRLMDTPANWKTPKIFSQIVTETLNIGGVDVIVRDKSWAENKKMGAFLSVAKGSLEPPAFLEIKYMGDPNNSKPIALVGKGVTFDSGGLSLKKAENMDLMRGDVGGGSCVVGTIYAAARLKLPVNIVGLVPLTENMPSGSANKPGDVVYAMNGKSITIIDTDYEGRLILADALCYAQEFKPRFVINMATLTLEILIALGASASGAYSNSTPLVESLCQAGALSGDRVWRMPLWRYFSQQVTNSQYSDLINLAGPMGGSCTAAAFLQEFMPKGDWIHLDIASVMGIGDTTPYLSKGMTGRPTRTLIEFIIKQING